MAPIRCCFDQTAVWHSDAARGPSTPSFDHLVGEREQLVRHVNAERSSGLEINHQLKLDRLLDRQVVRFGTLENLPDIMEAHLAKEAPANTIAHQAAVKDGS